MWRKVRRQYQACKNKSGWQQGLNLNAATTKESVISTPGCSLKCPSKEHLGAAVACISVRRRQMLSAWNIRH